MGRKVYVGGLSYNTSDDGLRAEFAKHGTVESATVIKDRYSDRSKGFGFVEMSTDAEAEEAIRALNGTELDGRQIIVNHAKERTDRGGGGGGGGGGYGGQRY
ncbi:MAG: RNA-binding protein [Dehalococcoidia bacterium]